MKTASKVLGHAALAKRNASPVVAVVRRLEDASRPHAAAGAADVAMPQCQFEIVSDAMQRIFAALARHIPVSFPPTCWQVPGWARGPPGQTPLP